MRASVANQRGNATAAAEREQGVAPAQGGDAGSPAQPRRDPVAGGESGGNAAALLVEPQSNPDESAAPVADGAGMGVSPKREASAECTVDANLHAVLQRKPEAGRSPAPARDGMESNAARPSMEPPPGRTGGATTVAGDSGAGAARGCEASEGRSGPRGRLLVKEQFAMKQWWRRRGHRRRLECARLPGGRVGAGDGSQESAGRSRVSELNSASATGSRCNGPRGRMP